MTIKEAIDEIKEEFNLFLKGCGLISEEQIKVRMECNDDFRKVYEANMLAIKTLEEKEAEQNIPYKPKDIVFCKDCKHTATWRSEESARKYGQERECLIGMLNCTKDYDFCSRGERRVH